MKSIIVSGGSFVLTWTSLRRREICFRPCAQCVQLSSLQPLSRVLTIAIPIPKSNPDKDGKLQLQVKGGVVSRERGGAKIDHHILDETNV